MTTPNYICKIDLTYQINVSLKDVNLMGNIKMFNHELAMFQIKRITYSMP